MLETFVDKYSGKRILVFGLAKSGTMTAKILKQAGAQLLVYDQKSDTKEQRELQDLGIQVVTGEPPLELLTAEFALMVKNPGIPYTNPLVKKALDLSIPIVSEVELAYELSKAPIIGITGSNGKTTTTTLIGEMLNQAGKRAVVAGNIGTVLIGEATTITEQEILVAELSSFQLKGTIDFRPHIAILLNVYHAHLDYHQGLADYVHSKSKIFANQTGDDYAIFNYNCEMCVEMSRDVKAHCLYFSTTGRQGLNEGAYIENAAVYFIEAGQPIKIIELTETKIRGAHLENALAAIIASKLVGADNDSIREVLHTFKGVEHRIEFVLSTADNIAFYNDSKSTNTQATITALDSFSEPVILIAGGLDRGLGFAELEEYFRRSVKALITYGETAQKLAETGKIAGVGTIRLADSLAEAVKQAVSIAVAGDTVLLSPAAASWDMFNSFEERGDLFKEIVRSYYN
jgi:UDP-N-acetylmuramoylalanine--D-glutamate ligase